MDTNTFADVAVSKWPWLLAKADGFILHRTPSEIKTHFGPPKATTKM
jgi:hypothetical protein